MNFIQERVDKLVNLAALRINETFFDEAAVDYEAVRLASHPVVILVCVNGFDAAKHDFESANFVVLKDEGDCCHRYLCGEIPSVEFEAVGTLNAALVPLLRTALNRLASRPLLRVVASDGIAGTATPRRAVKPRLVATKGRAD